MPKSRLSNAAMCRWQQCAPAPSPLCTLTKTLTLVGLAVIALWPSARSHHPWLGWLPLWFVGMPLASWMALHYAKTRRKPTSSP